MKEKLYFIATEKGMGIKVGVSPEDWDEEAGIKVPSDYIRLEEGDSILSEFEVDEMKGIFCITTKGFGFRFQPSDLRAMGKGMPGVRIAKLEDEVITNQGGIVYDMIG